MVNKEQSDMIDMLLQGKAIADISKVLNKSRTTIYNWLKLDFVNEELECRKAQLIKVARDKINSNVDVCINNIVELANFSKDPRVRLQANTYLINQSIGVPGTYKDDLNIYKDKDSKDVNKLKEELESIKKIRVVK